MSSANTPVVSETAVAVAEREERAATPGLCVGNCNRRWVDTGRGVPRYGDPVSCPRCISTVRRQLEELDSAAAIAMAAADGHRSSTGSDDSAIRMHRGSSAAKSASPMHDMLDELEGCLREWMRVKRPRAARLGFLASEITEASAWLLFNLPSYTDDRQHAAAFLEDISRWHGRLVKRGKAGSPLMSKPIPCPRCRQFPALVQDSDKNIVKCTECGKMLSVQDYNDLAAEAAEQSEAGARPSPPPARTRRSA